MSKQTHILTPAHHAHLAKIGIPWLRPPHIRCSKEEYDEAYRQWRKTHPEKPHDFIHMKALGHIAWAQHQESLRISPDDKRRRRDDRILWVLLAIIVLLLVPRAHCQFSHINYIDVQNQGSDIGFFTSPFTINFTGAGVSCSNSAGVITCSVTGGSITNNPGGSNTNVQYNNSGVFGGIANGNLGQVLISQGASSPPAFADPLVQGTQAAASTTIPNPVVSGGSDYGGTPAVRIWKVDSSGNGYAVITFAAPQHAIIDSGTISLPSNAAQETGGNLAAIKTDVDKIPASPSTDRTTAAAPFSTELSDGAAFYTAAKTGQLPSALDGSGFLKTHEQGTAAISGTVTANAGTGTMTVGQATGTNLHMVCDSGCSSSAGFADSAAFTTGTTAINPVGGLFDDTPPTAITTGHAAAARITPNRAIHINLRNQAGTEIGTSSNPVRVDPTGTTTQPVSGSVSVSNFPGTQPVSGTVTSNQGTANTAANAWPVIPGDGASNMGTQANFGTSPGAVKSLNVNASLFVGTAAPSASNPLPARECDGTNCVTIDPCRINANSFAKISQTANTQIITGTSAKKTYICSINLVTAGANNVAIVEGTGTTCATGIAGVSTGGTTAATGWNFAANGGLTEGSGLGSVMAANNANADNVCILQSAAVQLSGVIGYVQQ